jgi:hypothetical protein
VLTALALRPRSATLAPDGAGVAGVRTYPGTTPAVSVGNAPTAAQQTAQTRASPDEPILPTGRTVIRTDALDRIFIGLASGQDDPLLKF